MNSIKDSFFIIFVTLFVSLQCYASKSCKGTLSNVGRGHWINVETPERMIALEQHLIQLGILDFSSIEFLGEGDQANVVRLNYRPDLDQSPIISKQFKEPIGPLALAVREQIGPMYLVQFHFLVSLRAALLATGDLSFKVAEVVGKELFGESIELANIVGRDLHKILMDDRIDPNRRSELLNSYNQRVDVMISQLRAIFPRVEVSPFTEPGFEVYQNYNLGPNPIGVAPVVTIAFGNETERYFMLLKPDNVIVGEDLSMTIIDMN